MAPRITLLVPTFNRSGYLARQLDYLKSFDRSFYAIAVLDGSTKPDEQSKNAALAAQHGVDLQWQDSTAVSYYDRIIEGVRRTGTDYVQVVPDDDYFSDTALRTHADMLDQTPDAVSAFGHAIGFLRRGEPSADGVLRLDVADYRNRPDYAFDHPLVRLHYALLEKSRSAYYCLYRTEVAGRIYAAARTYGQLDDADSAAAGSLVDPLSYYFADLFMIAMPVIMGKKLNSGLPSVVCETGQSFNAAHRSDIVGPPRQPYYMLPADEAFQFPDRLRRFVDGVVIEYTKLHDCPDINELTQFLTSLTMVVIGSTAMTGDWISRYNALLETLAVDPPARVLTAARIFTHHSVLDDPVEPSDCAVCRAGGRDLCRSVRADYAFAIDHAARHHGLRRSQVMETGRTTELEFARTMFSFDRPLPYAVIGSTSPEPGPT